jgi:hypothetical protein
MPEGIGARGALNPEAVSTRLTSAVERARQALESATTPTQKDAARGSLERAVKRLTDWTLHGIAPTEE